jgi:hypothetical protein
MPLLRLILAQAWKILGESDYFRVDCTPHEGIPLRPPHRRWFGVMSIRFPDPIQFGFQPGHPAVAPGEDIFGPLGVRHRDELFDQVIRAARLPVRRVDREDGRWFENTAGGRCHIGSGMHGEGALQFLCEMPNCGAEGLAERFATALAVSIGDGPADHELHFEYHRIMPPRAPDV